MRQLRLQVVVMPVHSEAILMAIKPEYAEAILDGRKTVEFRKAMLPDNVETVYLYATAPVKRVVGCFESDHQFSSTPRDVWELYGDNGACTKESYDKYFKGCLKAVAIHISRVFKCDPFDPRAVRGAKWIPPQSWYYIYKLILAMPAMKLVSPRPADLPPPGGGKKVVRK
jgi:predicted transcriptional regulator